jgi:fumarate reductase subunit C
MYNNKENMYWEYEGSIFIFLNDSLHESLFLLFVIILFFFNSKNCYTVWRIAPKNYTISYNRMYIEKNIILKASWDITNLTVLIAKQAEFNLHNK